MKSESISFTLPYSAQNAVIRLNQILNSREIKSTSVSDITSGSSQLDRVTQADFQIVAEGKDFSVMNSGCWAVQIYICNLQNGACEVTLVALGDEVSDKFAAGFGGVSATRQIVYLSNSRKKRDLIRQRLIQS